MPVKNLKRLTEPKPSLLEKNGERPLSMITNTTITIKDADNNAMKKRIFSTS
jgi:hypothetical protein